MNRNASSVLPFNPLQPGLNADPYPVYREFREKDPVHWNGAWFLFRYEDAMEALRDPALGREPSRFLPPGPVGDVLRRWMLFRNPPDHTRLRALVGKAFSTGVVQRLVPRIEAIAAELVDGFAERGQADLIGAFASAFPVLVIAEMLGVPGEDRERFRKWSMALSAAVDLHASPALRARSMGPVLELIEYLRGFVAQRRREPRSDLVSALIAAEEAGDRLDEEELIAMATLLLGAGHETTVNLIGNGCLALLRHPETLARWPTDPEAEAVAVEELLRYDSPVQMTFREALAETTIAGRTLRVGQPVCAILGSANRDPAHFSDPDTLDLARPADRRHAAFGNGIHHCLGAMLARVEGRVAFRTLLGRLPDLRLASGELKWREGILFHGLEALPVRFGGK